MASISRLERLNQGIVTSSSDMLYTLSSPVWVTFATPLRPDVAIGKAPLSHLCIPRPITQEQPSLASQPGGTAYPSDIFSAGAFLWFVAVPLLSVRLSQFGCLHLHNSFPKIGAWCDIGSRWNALTGITMNAPRSCPVSHDSAQLRGSRSEMALIPSIEDPYHPVYGAKYGRCQFAPSDEKKFAFY
ncbi:uncharacterized protein BO96DRAFT_469769 [Aspergillus niger CBS 101883]|uniref:Uncharacterized protein n=2 Tax=Aspergillus niger TaxID=5061 RepID=A2RB28_ASPNC|nr:uncharacterized protein BO96DRAFT_469769 [Aspergillus niger CBS 101883]XP_059606596.1 hypothetical protein An18g05260 [Aspergillus niger]PYH51776.1 hypothetical protein BO96DRAFT_469769 [Aspergillus niger CBS 101883]CAK97448.1 hypothetical protein An18g05260 [Aspergillus niger]